MLTSSTTPPPSVPSVPSVPSAIEIVDEKVTQTLSSPIATYVQERKLQYDSSSAALQATYTKPETQQLFAIAYQRFIALKESKTTSVASILILIGLTTQIVQRLTETDFPQITNQEKKAIVVRLITQWVNDSTHLSEDDKLYLTTIYIPIMLSGAIDSLCSFDIHKVVKSGISTLFSCCK